MGAPSGLPGPPVGPLRAPGPAARPLSRAALPARRSARPLGGPLRRARAPSAPRPGLRGSLGLSAGRPPRRRGRAAPRAGPAAAWPRPAVGGLASPPSRPPGWGGRGPRSPAVCGPPGVGWGPLPRSARVPRPFPPCARGPPARPYRAARLRHGPPRLLPRGARGGGHRPPKKPRAPPGHGVALGAARSRV